MDSLIFYEYDAQNGPPKKNVAWKTILLSKSLKNCEILLLFIMNYYFMELSGNFVEPVTVLTVFTICICSFDFSPECERVASRFVVGDFGAEG